MGYRVEYLTKEKARDLGLESHECEVCKEINRNVIEPIAVFLKDDETLESLSKDELKKFTTCIFHCEKENEIWIENIDEYKEWKEKREKARKEKKEFYIEFSIKWRENLINEFWKRIRAYRFAVDYPEKEIPEKIEKNVSYDTALVNYYRELLNKSEEKDYYDFKWVIFPEFSEFDDDIRDENNFLKKDFNFWYEGEECKFIKHLNFGDATFLGEAYFRNATYRGWAYFGDVTFRGEAYFGDATFRGEANFMHATFQGEVYFGDATFQGDAYFRGATFQVYANFWGATFQGDADFLVATFQGDANFREATFQKYANFWGATFQVYANFWGATFQGDADFERATFQGDANFREATFQGDANFREATFQKYANFWGATFQKYANFWGATFQGEADFLVATFQGDANFREATFQKYANFWGATFQVYANFWGATFQGEADFERATFQGKTDFFVATFQGDANFRRATFQKYANFWRATFQKYANFLGATFQGDADFLVATFQGDADFGGVYFNNPIIFKSVEIKSKFVIDSQGKSINHLEIFNPQFSSNAQIELKNINIGILKLNNLTNHAKEFVIFNLNFKGDKELYFEINNSILNKMRFINCDFSNAKEINIIDSSISDAEFINTKWGEVSEKRICKDLFEKEPDRAQDIYRQLKLAHDKQKDFIHGGDFYALEMRAYERYLNYGNSNLAEQNLSILKRFFYKSYFILKNFLSTSLEDKLIFGISKLSSNFAQNWFRPLKWILFFAMYVSFFNLLDKDKLYLRLYEFTQLFFLNKIDYYFILWTLLPFLLVCFFALSLVNFKKWWRLLEFLIYLLLSLCVIYIFGIFQTFSTEHFIKTFFTGLDFFFSSFAKLFVPWRTIANSENANHIPGYKTAYAIGSIAVSYLAYQLIVSLRRKIRR
ncbi:hypothetical protein TTHT_0956 [Thermotomaculum hydrothermale]|uniref:Pentapeptide repeat-containing protein n=1 Tax=Thermotomaculum hydrothermale TaxID=981385 RepID=A0A7R6PF08_9BACT|nr:pentapeptide repeat-containing protein [Thermotomaculum hydrothermale]BBB32509.1 hypothetical protein TTHT_0956 [Thermotomaculum hydrothermale]